MKIGAMKAILPSGNVNEFLSVPARFTVNELDKIWYRIYPEKNYQGFWGEFRENRGSESHISFRERK